METASAEMTPFNLIFRTRILPFTLTAISVSLLSLLIYTFSVEPISIGWVNLQKDPWGVSALLDYVTGAIFISIFLWYRNGPPMFYVPCRVIAVLSPFIGNFLPLTYMAFLYFTCQPLLIPPSSSSPSSSTQSNTINKKTTILVGLLFTGLLIVFIGVCAWAFIERGLSGMKLIEPWIIMTFADNVVGLVFTLIYVIERQGGLFQFKHWISWLILLIFFGNGATCCYILLCVLDALIQNINLRTILLTERQKLSNYQTLL